jgi:hypothetical protein
MMTKVPYLAAGSLRQLRGVLVRCADEKGGPQWLWQRSSAQTRFPRSSRTGQPWR